MKKSVSDQSYSDLRKIYRRRFWFFSKRTARHSCAPRKMTPRFSMTLYGPDISLFNYHSFIALSKKWLCLKILHINLLNIFSNFSDVKRMLVSEINDKMYPNRILVFPLKLWHNWNHCINRFCIRWHDHYKLNIYKRGFSWPRLTFFYFLMDPHSKVKGLKATASPSLLSSSQKRAPSHFQHALWIGKKMVWHRNRF